MQVWVSRFLTLVRNTGLEDRVRNGQAGIAIRVTIGDKGSPLIPTASSVLWGIRARIPAGTATSADVLGICRRMAVRSFPTFFHALAPTKVVL